MNLQKLGKKLKKELLRNPKKSAMLAGACLVAVYFWLPLIRKWTASKTPPAVPAVAANAAVVPVAAAPLAPAATSAMGNAAAGSVAATKLPRWDALLKMIQADPLALPATLQGGGLDPFVVPVTAAEVAEQQRREEREKPEVKQTVVPEPTVADLGLKLTSTLVMKGGGRATINGRSYAVGSLVVVPGSHRDQPLKQSSETAAAPEAEDDEAATPPEEAAASEPGYQLVEVGSDFVVLERNEKRFELRLPRTGDVAGNRFTIFEGNIAVE